MHTGLVDVVEDDDSLRNSIQDLLAFAGYDVRAWRNAESYLAQLPQTAPAVLVTDMRMPDRSGLEIHQELIARGRHLPVVYISGASSVTQSISAMKLGAVDFLVKPFTRDELLRAVAAGIERDRAQMRQRVEQTRFKAALQHLSPREREVFQLLLKGFSNAEIMDSLGISLPTAKQYKSMVMRKLGARSLSQLMQFGARLNTDPDTAEAA